MHANTVRRQSAKRERGFHERTDAGFVLIGRLADDSAFWRCTPEPAAMNDEARQLIDEARASLAEIKRLRLALIAQLDQFDTYLSSHQGAVAAVLDRARQDRPTRRHETVKALALAALCRMKVAEADTRIADGERRTAEALNRLEAQGE
jgi:hypothetical protein